MDNNRLRPPENLSGQSRPMDAIQPSIELTPMPNEEAISSASSLSPSNTPPSTPATSLRPSSHSSEISPVSRPVAFGHSPSQSTADEGIGEDPSTQDLDPVPEGEAVSPHATDGGSARLIPLWRPMEAACQSWSSWRSTLQTQAPRWDSFQTFIGLVVSILAVITFAFSYRTYELAKWESWHDFRDDCAADDNRKKSKGCQNFLSRPLVEPPYQTNSGVMRLTVRAVKPVVKMSLRMRHSWPLNLWLGLVTLVVISYMFLRIWLRNKSGKGSDRSEEIHTPSHPPAPWHSIPLTWLRRLRYTNVPGDWTPVPVRLEGIATSVDLIEGQDRGRRRYIPTRPETKPEQNFTPMGPGARKLSFQERISDLWVNPPWRRRGTLPTLEGEKVDEESERWSNDGKHRDPSPSLISNSESSTHGTVSSLRSSLRRRIPRHDSASSSDSEFSPFTTLGTDPDRKSSSSESYRSGTRLRIKDGAVSLGIAKTGEAIASTIGGEAGQELRIHEVSSSDTDVPLPQAPQDISTSQ